MPHVEADGIRIHYLSEGEGAAVVMVHGLLDNLAVWHMGLVPALRDRFRLVTYDLRGHGFSDMTPTGYTPSILAADLERLINALGIERPLLVGHSYGADVALRFCVQHPGRVAALAAIEPALAGVGDDDAGWGGWSYWAGRMRAAGRSVPAGREMDLGYLLEGSLDAPRAAGFLRGRPRSPEPLLRLIRETTLLADCGEAKHLMHETASRVAVPVLLLCGERSEFRPSFDFLREALPDVRPVLLSGDRPHEAPWEDAERIARHIREFFAEATGRGRLLHEVA
jgi:pimeloyl-ACP methyl ester carboxylesterase